MALISAGWTYEFQFTKKFSEYNGPYTIAKIYSWAEVVNDQLSLYELLYAPLNIPETEYNEDIKTYMQESVYKLVSPVSGKIVYAPESILDALPIYPVKEYQRLVLFIPLGVYDSVEGLDYLMQQVADEVRGALGISAEPKLTTTGKVYLTESDYNALEDGRKARTDRVLNWFSAFRRLQEENAKLKAQVQGYQEMLNKLIGD